VILPVLLNHNTAGEGAREHEEAPTSELLHLNELSIAIILQHFPVADLLHFKSGG
jgi:hypothetical protein